MSINKKSYKDVSKGLKQSTQRHSGPRAGAGKSAGEACLEEFAGKYCGWGVDGVCSKQLERGGQASGARLTCWHGNLAPMLERLPRERAHPEAFSLLRVTVPIVP